ncbi:hypothetical protein SUGI_0375580 [Cryptomeria japonica]|uniref:GRAS family protein RAM1-like n=1 Tax=Cryptomeria japonica TaxID=3369 RepID=UPI002408B9B5|nr:GRAS family protein RAM1-like [Cryptomeria japonica]GLJ20620.1 hypothetical protein SUGI_0375580 [Cryptomeria japonica]
MDNPNLSAQFGEFPSLPNTQISHELLVATEEGGHENGLSSEEIIKAAGTQYMDACCNEGFNLNQFFAVPALPREIRNGLEMAHLLLCSADMISNRRYEEASRMLSQCKKLSSQLGHPIQRLCYYFSEALQERIERQISSEPNKAKQITPDYYLLALCTTVSPYAKVLQFTGVQAILDAVRGEKRIHVIDMGIRTGCQWTTLIQSLSHKISSSSVRHLRMTAVGVNSDVLEDSGKRLTEFAKTMEIRFSYRSVRISNMEEIHEGLFNVKAGEFVAVYAPIVFGRLLYDPILLGNTVNVIMKLKPHILVVSEVEAQHNSPSFPNRFIEALFYYSAYFDCLEAVRHDRNDLKRVKYEEVCLQNEIRNIIACEGESRWARHIMMDRWRCFFRMVGFIEMRFSYRAWYQARLLLNEYNHGDNFTIEPNGSAMSVGWKGTRLYTQSVWSCKRMPKG